MIFSSSEAIHHVTKPFCCLVQHEIELVEVAVHDARPEEPHHQAHEALQHLARSSTSPSVPRLVRMLQASELEEWRRMDLKTSGTAGIHHMLSTYEAIWDG